MASTRILQKLERGVFGYEKYFMSGESEREVDIKLFFCEENLVNKVNIMTISKFNWGNRYLLTSHCHTKILEWLLSRNFTSHKAIITIVKNIEDTNKYTYTTLLILIILYSDKIYKVEHNIELKSIILPIIEKCISNIDNFKIDELLLLKATMSFSCDFNIISYCSALTELLLAHNTSTINNGTLLSLYKHGFRVLEPDRFMN